MKLVSRAAATTSLIAVAMLVAVPAQAASPPAPSATDQPARDGCQRSNFGIGFDTSPEFVYVYRNPVIRMATGIVRVAHASLQDAILEHRSFDFNANLVPDPQYRFLIAGSRTLHTSNYAPSGGEEQGRLHFEWESTTLPMFAWPTDGDRATVWGSWIWDCGHWQSGNNNTSNVTTGEHSELHPLNGIAVNRRTPYRSARAASETDVFISNQGDAAHAIEQCALSHHPQKPAAYPQYDADFKPCATSSANPLQPLASSYPSSFPLRQGHPRPRSYSSGSLTGSAAARAPRASAGPRAGSTSRSSWLASATRSSTVRASSHGGAAPFAIGPI